MNITDKQRAHARRHALQDAPAYAKGRTVTPEKISNHAEYQATISGAPKTEPARTQWKEIYRDTMTAYMINAQHLSPEHEQQERDRLDPPQNTAQTTIRAGKDEYNRPNVYAIWQTAGTWYSAQIWQAEKGKALDRGEAINVQPHATRQEALARRRALAHGEEPEPPVITPLPAVNHREEAAKYKALADNVFYHYREEAREAYEREIAAAEAQERAATPPAPKVQVTKDGPAYLLPGIEPAGKQKGEATQTALF